MKITHVSDRYAREGTIDDVFARIADDDAGWKTTLELLASLRANINGPEVWACESHHKLFLMPYDRPDSGQDDNYDRFTQVQVFACSSNFSVYYDVPKSLAPVPWYSRYCIQPVTLAQATVACFHAVSTMLSMFDPDVESPTLENNNSEITTRCTPDGLAKCPNCDTGFSLYNPSEWDGSRHVLCKQLLNVTRRKAD